MPGGVRGATFIDVDTPEAIWAGTRELLAAIAQANDIATEDMASAFFTSTADLRSAFPARAARELGWTNAPRSA
jgi:chorismate mutase